ncbi:hypothetical protein SAMN06265361_10431 [Laceyella tengchongensis]|uniref:Uncharacterized protein n=1 Tax=Laceyella tengchongensis TaxID=574699 RepID=A0AA46AFN1_9BACL|nr:hypothetical protein [Laceyella tengchongensis]SMP22287.1 hypothetical protein SAMN06265361_10431 [Laceyella tengchongensis]
MKLNKIFVFIAVGVLLVVIGGLFFYFLSESETAFEGEWKRVEESGCPLSLRFYEGKTLNIEYREGHSETGTLTELGEGEYKFDIQILSVVVGIKKINDYMLYFRDHEGDVCRYKKIDKE